MLGVCYDHDPKFEWKKFIESRCQSSYMFDKIIKIDHQTREVSGHLALEEM